MYDYILWYSKDKETAKFRPLFTSKNIEDDREYRFIDDSDASIGYRKIKEDEFRALEDYSKVFRRSALTSSGYTATCTFPFDFQGIECKPFGRKSWRTNRSGIDTLIEKNRIFVLAKNAYFKLYYSDFPYISMENSWTEQAAAGERYYVVQTGEKFIQRCMLMTTDPGDLVLDPTCGSGTTAYVAEQWGRRWITIDTSRVPMALARQRILTATFPYYQLKDETRGPVGGFVFKRKRNNRGEEVGGIVPHVTLGSIANNEPPAEEVLVDRPEVETGITRVSGPFVVEGTIPTPVEWDGGDQPEAGANGQADGTFTDRMLEVLRRSPVLRLEGNKTVTLKNVRPPAKTLSLSAEALVVDGDERPVSFVFGPENGPVGERQVQEALRESYMKGYAHLYVIGFAVEPNARMLIEQAAQIGDVPATYVQATPDLMMGDLLKNMRSSQIFSVCGLPEVKLHPPEAGKHRVELVGLDVFDPVTMDVEHRRGDDVPAWFLDSDYNGLCFHVSQAFFPRTSAWDSLQKALKGSHDESVWDHLSGTISAPFEAGEHRQIAVKVIDDRGNELIVVKKLPE